MTNNRQRSAKCPPSTVQSAVVERPRPGVQKLATGPMYFNTKAIVHSTYLASLWNRLPATHSTAGIVN